MLAELRSTSTSEGMFSATLSAMVRWLQCLCNSRYCKVPGYEVGIDNSRSRLHEFPIMLMAINVKQRHIVAHAINYFPPAGSSCAGAMISAGSITICRTKMRLSKESCIQCPSIGERFHFTNRFLCSVIQKSLVMKTCLESHFTRYIVCYIVEFGEAVVGGRR